MPLEVSAEPIAKNDVKAVIPTIRTFTPALEQSTSSIPKVQREISRECLEVKKKFGDIPEETLDTVFNLLYGPLMLPEDLLKARDLSVVKEKETRARLAQTLAHYIFQASTPQADPEFARGVYDMVRLGHKMSFLRPIEENSQIINIWKGIQNELAVIRALKLGGHRVYVPDYAQDPFTVPDDDNEVLQLDVKSGVDMIAVKNHRIILIDSKGRITQQKVELIDKREVDPKWEWNPLLRNVISRIPHSSVFRTVVMIPTGANRFVNPPFPQNPTDPSRELSLFGRLSPLDEADIIHAVDNIAQVAAPRVYSFA